MLDSRVCKVKTPEELNIEIKDIMALDLLGEGHQICGTLNVQYTDESVKTASQLFLLEERGVAINWIRL
jgi:hypothetical protein